MNENMLFYSKENKLIVEHLYTVEGYCTLNIQVKSGAFAGSSNFCLPKEKVQLLIEKIFIMHQELEGSCKVEDSDSDAYVEIKMDKLGQIYLYGQIGGSHEEHFLRFKYTIDQTVLVTLIQVLKSAL